MFMVDINNPSAEKVYVKLWDAATATVGTDAVDCCLPCAAGSAVAYSIPDGLDFDTDISSACVQEAGDAGTTAPSSAVTVKILTN